jgi:thymidine kinase
MRHGANRIIQPREMGWVEVICGPMFSGKTEELIRRVKRADYAGQPFQLFKPRIDDRYDTDAIVSHDDSELPCIPVPGVEELRDRVEADVEVVAIDEVQFFGDEIIAVCDELADSGCRVVVAGLDLDYQGRPFPPVPELLAVAEYVDKLSAICVRCGNPASYSYRLASDPQQVLVGSEGEYEARCRQCFREGYPSKETTGEDERLEDEIEGPTDGPSGEGVSASEVTDE